jgi:hypothetical protein
MRTLRLSEMQEHVLDYLMEIGETAGRECRMLEDLPF